MERLSKEAREARNAYLREWRNRNKEKDAEYKKRYWERKAEQKKSE